LIIYDVARDDPPRDMIELDVILAAFSGLPLTKLVLAFVES
jgi:hypothetical protein